MKLQFSLPLQLIAVIIGVLLFGSLIPIQVVEICYTFSVLFKELLGFLLPFMVFFFVMVMSGFAMGIVLIFIVQNLL